jgi:hypothetical protein
MTPEQARLLKEVPSHCDFQDVYDLVAERYGGRVLAEVGVWFGASVLYLALKAKEQAPVIFAIDTFETAPTLYGKPRSLPVRTLIAEHGDREQALRHYMRLLGVHDAVVPWKGRSPEVAKEFAEESFAFVFVDASHRYAHVKLDLPVWYDRAYYALAGHDYDTAGVRRAVDEFVKERGLEDKFFTVGKRSWWINKAEQRAPEGIIRAAGRLR